MGRNGASSIGVGSSTETTLQQELDRYHQLHSARLAGYRAGKRLTVPEQVLQVLVSHTEKSARISPAAWSEMLATVTTMVKAGRPISLAMSYATGVRLPNPLKFRERVNLPHLGWMHFFAFFTLLNRKVQTVYTPGITVDLFEEGTLFGHLFGWTEAEVSSCIEAARRMIHGLKAPITIHPMRHDTFPSNAVETIEVPLSDEAVYAYLCTLPDMEDPEVMATLYRDRGRDYTAIRSRHPQLWEKARRIATYVLQRTTYRKQAALFRQWMGEREFLDVTITEKHDRLSLDPMSVLPSHGIPVVTRGRNNEFKLAIEPEYRVNGGARPVLLCESELGVLGRRRFTFYYERVA